LGHERRAYSTIDIQFLVPTQFLYVMQNDSNLKFNQIKPSMWKNETKKRKNNDFNPVSAYVFTNPFIWIGYLSVVHITIFVESSLRRLWALQKSQKPLQCVNL
jgi:hypothetical protein